MRVFKRLTAAAATCAISGTVLGAAGNLAHATVGQPSDWELGLQPSASPIMDSILSFHHFLLVIICAITLLVMTLLVICMIRFNARAHPVPSRTTHNTLLEVLWTIVPVLILVTIALPSFKLLFNELDIPKADLTVKATGKQWYWTFSYPDNGPFEFDSLLVKKADLKPGQPRLLTSDNPLVVPVNKVVRVLTTGADVIHSFAVPAFGIKIDAIPGRINETWFKATKEGTFYGQCSELCGRDHAFMPIDVKVVSEQAFTAWLADAKKKYADNGDRSSKTDYAAAKPETAHPTKVAAAQ